MSDKNKQDLIELELEKQFDAVLGLTSSPSANLLEVEKVEPKQSVDGATKDADPLFRLLAEPKLPELPKDDRARLQLQSPNRIHFYWSIKSNPFKILSKALHGRTGSYVLVAKLRNLSTKEEKIFPVDASGSWWFSVDADSEYRAEIGFYAPNRPYVRIINSNTLKTPRKTPSRRTDYTPSFTVTSADFAKALDAAGYKQDAFDVAIAGDDPISAQTATVNSYKEIAGQDFRGVAARHESELRFVLMALAAGHTLEEIRSLIDPALYELIQKDLVGVSADDAMHVLEEHFDVVAGDVYDIEEIGEAVVGASLIHFPRRIRQKRVPKSLLPKISELRNRKSITSFGKSDK